MRMDNAPIIVYLEEEQGTQQQLETIVENHETQEDETRDETVDKSMDNSDRGNNMLSCRLL